MRVRVPLALALLGGAMVVLLSASAEAQPRRRGPAVRPRPVVVHVRPYYRPSYWSAGWGYRPWFWSPYGPYHPAFYPGPASPDSGLRLSVDPKDAEVFVNGYFTGIVDDFDGLFQRLSLPPGEYEITLYRDGYHSVTQQVLVRPGTTQRLTYEMVALSPGEAPDPRPEPADPAEAPQPPPPWSPPSGRGMPPGAPRAEARFGQLVIRVQPEDAEVLIDGEPWQAPAGADRLVVHLAPGGHEIEVRRDGFDTFVATVQIRPGEDTTLNVSLHR